MPTLQQYPPGILDVCEKASELSKNLVDKWLRSYMLKDHPEGATIASDVADWLGDNAIHLSHSRPITLEELKDRKLKVTALEDDQALQEAVLTLFHTVTHTFGMGSAVKLIENQDGRRLVRHGGPQIVINPGMIAPPGP